MTATSNLENEDPNNETRREQEKKKLKKLRVLAKITWFIIMEGNIDKLR